jgi:hypothetical protein
MRNEEEVETSFDDLGLLHETVVHICTLRRVQDVRGVRPWVISGFLKESLSHTFVDDDECELGEGASLRLGVVFVSQDLLQLLELEVNDFLAH